MRNQQFVLPQNQIYMCGHSLGPMPNCTPQYINQAIHAFATQGVQAWNQQQWINLAQKLCHPLATLLGSHHSEIVICDSTVINLYKIIYAALQLQAPKNIILTTENNFPADLYILQGLKKLTGIQLKIVKQEQLIEAMDSNIALLTLSHINYRDAQMFSIPELNHIAKKHNILTVWDLSHSVGLCPLHLSQWDTDFAVGCSYKYLNGGPGSPAFIYVNSKHQHHIQTPIQTWLGHQDPFQFAPDYHSAGIQQFTGGTPAIFSMVALDAALTCFAHLSLPELYAQTLRQAEQLIRGLKQLQIHVLTPKHRGGHVGFTHPDAYGISRALLAHGVICDYRAPDLVRLCTTALYLHPHDIEECLALLTTILKKQLFLKPEFNQIIQVT